LIALGEAIARFGAPLSVRSNVVAAGFIASDTPGPSVESVENLLLKRLGTAREVADAVVFLASDASAYITAQTLNVNGGLYS
jgi:3-oxoacyl-[acyl-carrier protein] reductase